MGGRGSSSGSERGALADVFAGRVPSESDIKTGNATYGGIPIVYNPNKQNEASNLTSSIEVGDQLFQQSASGQREILNHEVSHNYSDDMIARYATERGFMDAFVQERPVPQGSAAWERGQRTYRMGLYGDIGATALVETTTLAIQEYISNPEALRQRSAAAYGFVRRFVRGRR